MLLFFKQWASFDLLKEDKKHSFSQDYQRIFQKSCQMSQGLWSNGRRDSLLSFQFSKACLALKVIKSQVAGTRFETLPFNFRSINFL